MNPGFETGNASGWTVFDDSNPYWGCNNPYVGTLNTHSGLFTASMRISESCSDEGPAGWEQTVSVTQGESYTASTWYSQFYGGNEDTAMLQILDSAGSVIAQDSIVGYYPGQVWQRITVPFTASSDTVRFRIAFSFVWGGGNFVMFDDALLVEESVSDLRNPGFDAGLDQWTIVGPSNGTVTPVDVGGFTAALLDSQTGQPIGVEQVFDGYGTNTVTASVSLADGLDSQLTLEVLRLDGTVIDTCSTTLALGQGTISTCSVNWSIATEDLLVYRITTTGSPSGPASVYVEDVTVGVSP
jgi:hypothetical protein